MNAVHRKVLRDVVRHDDGIDILICHHADGSNDYFSAKPEVQECERHRIIEVCLEIAIALESMPERPAQCPGDSRQGRGCPA